jgi:hypothetical protein
MIKFRQNWSMRGVKHYVLRPTNLLILLGITKNGHSSGRNQPIRTTVVALKMETVCFSETSLYSVTSSSSQPWKPQISTVIDCVEGYLIFSFWKYPTFFSKIVDKIIGHQQSGPRSNRSITDQILCIRQTLRQKRGYNGTLHQLFIIHLKKASKLNFASNCPLLLELNMEAY